MTKIAVLIGSLQEKSFNKMLARNLADLAPAGVSFEYVDINLPLFNQDLEADFPAAARTAKDIVEAADGVLFVTPEYNRSVPGVLKNSVDWISRPWGYNSFAGKPAGIVGASPSVVGTAVAQSDLRHVLVYLGMVLLGQPEVYIANAHQVFDENGKVVEGSRDFLESYITALVQFVEKQKTA